tara:strand:+ start:75 stop:1145 length:1071 start_codon:yes stop_codon:yes gene_type:complete
MDGIDASVIQTDGKYQYRTILDRYFAYPKDIYKDLTQLRDKIKSSNDLKKFSNKIQKIEEEITLFHANVIRMILKKTKVNVNLIGLHGQTIYHNAKEKISKQLGDGKFLSKFSKKNIVYDFRQNDLRNGGQGAPLTPIFHKLLKKKLKLKSATFLNIGGIINETSILKDGKMHAHDVGPGMCLIDKWVRENSKKRYDDKGNIAKSGTVNQKIFDAALKNWTQSIRTKSKKSLDIKEMDYYFNNSLHNLTLKNGAATLTAFTVAILVDFLLGILGSHSKFHKLIFCGGGRKNNFLIRSVNKFIGPTKLIDEYGIDGDFIESQAFAYLAVRSYLKLPISFPETTGCKKPTTGGKIIRI